jgi:hypothetical protein
MKWLFGHACSVKFRRIFYLSSFLAITGGLLTGCGSVSIKKERNWIPPNHTREDDLNKCIAAAPPATMAKGFVFIETVDKCNYIACCMREKGYQVRCEALWELSMDVFLFPIYFVTQPFMGKCLEQTRGTWGQIDCKNNRRIPLFH